VFNQKFLLIYIGRTLLFLVLLNSTLYALGPCPIPDFPFLPFFSSFTCYFFKMGKTKQKYWHDTGFLRMFGAKVEILVYGAIIRLFLFCIAKKRNQKTLVPCQYYFSRPKSCPFPPVLR
jgi:hypothetical protein